MKKLLLGLAMVTTVATAGGPRDGRHHTHGHWVHRGHAWEWVIPAVIGGVIVYQATKPPAPIVVQQEPGYDPNCSPWTEVINPDGSITRTRTCRR